MSETDVPSETESAVTKLTHTLNRIGQVADALYISANRNAALAFVSDDRLTWDYRREVARLAERYAADNQQADPLVAAVPLPVLPGLVAGAEVRQVVMKAPEEEQDWERIISSSAPKKGERRDLVRDAQTVLESGKHLLEVNRPEDALRCGVWLRWIHATNKGRESARTLIRGSLLAIRKQDKVAFFSAVKDVWEAHTHDKPIQDLAFASLIESVQAVLGRGRPNTAHRSRDLDLTPAYVRGVSRWICSRPGVTEAYVAQARSAVVPTLVRYREKDPVHTMAVVRELLQDPFFVRERDKILQQGIITLPLLAAVAPDQAIAVVHEGFLPVSQALTGESRPLNRIFTVFAQRDLSLMGGFARGLWNRHADLRGVVEYSYRQILEAAPPAVVPVTYGAIPANPRLDEISANVMKERLVGFAQERQVGKMVDMLLAIEQRAQNTPHIVLDVLGQKPRAVGDSDVIQFNKRQGGAKALLVYLRKASQPA